MTKPLKPWRSYEEQLQLLQARGLEVDNPATALDYCNRPTTTVFPS